MRFSCFLVLLLVTFTAFVQVLASDDNAIHASNLKTSSNHAIVTRGSSRRNLKGSITTGTENDVADEERHILSGITSKVAPAVKESDEFIKILEKSSTFTNAIKKNPDFANIVAENRGFAQILSKNHNLIKEFDNPAITTALRDALKNPTVLKSLQDNTDVQKIIAALPRAQGLTSTNIKTIGEAMTKSTTVSRGISDEAQQLTAWGAAIVGTIIIVLIGLHIANKK
ncbi:hypothetical protein PRIC1_004370 [Phytophthora ramorum]